MPGKPLGVKECADQLTRVKTNSSDGISSSCLIPSSHCEVKKNIWSYIHHTGNVCGLLEELAQHTLTLTRIVWSCWQTVNFWGCAWIWDGSTHMHYGKKKGKPTHWWVKVEYYNFNNEITNCINYTNTQLEPLTCIISTAMPCVVTPSTLIISQWTTSALKKQLRGRPFCSGRSCTPVL